MRAFAAEGSVLGFVATEWAGLKVANRAALQGQIECERLRRAQWAQWGQFVLYFLRFDSQIVSSHGFFQLLLGFEILFSVHIHSIDWNWIAHYALMPNRRLTPDRVPTVSLNA